MLIDIDGVIIDYKSYGDFERQLPDDKLIGFRVSEAFSERTEDAFFEVLNNMNPPPDPTEKQIVHIINNTIRSFRVLVFHTGYPDVVMCISYDFAAQNQKKSIEMKK